MEQNEQTTSQELAVVTSATEPKGFQCPKCARLPFETLQALRMHDMRVHTLKGRRGAKAGARKAGENKMKARERALAYKRDYNREYRARKKRERGYEEKKRNAYVRMRERYAQQGLKAHGQPYKDRRVTPIVYPPPTEESNHPQLILRYCPNCGAHLENWKQT